MWALFEDRWSKLMGSAVCQLEGALIHPQTRVLPPEWV